MDLDCALLVALLHARYPETLQLDESQKSLPARPWQGFLLGYGCGVLWYLGTCYWVFDTMHQYGGLSMPVGLLVLLLFALYLGLVPRLVRVAGQPARTQDSGNRLALLAAPFLWVAVELARTRISGFPWNLLGITQVDNIPLTRIATADRCLRPFLRNPAGKRGIRRRFRRASQPAARR